jgi:glucose/arabinose dehydrogenase
MPAFPILPRTRRRSPRFALPLAAVPFAVLAACADQSPTAPAAGPAFGRAPAATAAGAVTVVMSGLNSPKQLAFGPEGALYVAESGTGAENGPSIPAGDRGAPAFYSGTGSVSRLWKGAQERVVTGLPSLAAGGGNVTGPQDVAFQGRGNMYVTIGLGADPALRAGLGVLARGFGTLIVVRPNGQWEVAADIGGYEASANPDGGLEDTNPYGVLAEGGRQIVADAGGNSLVAVAPNGALSTLAVFPSFQIPAGSPFSAFGSSQAVPTEVERGPDGALYVSTLTGVPFLPGMAVIYRVTPGAAPTVYRGGFTAITDFAFGPDGSLYVVQFASGPFLNGPGSVVRVSADGTARTTLLGGLVAPTGIAVGADGAVYVTNKGFLVGAGEVLRIAP